VDTTKAEKTLMRFFVRRISSGGTIFALLTSSGLAGPFPISGPITSGNKACLRAGLACAPSKAPLAVKRAIWAANRLRSKSYRYGGGHRSFFDHCYDCSGTVSFALAGAGLINAPLSSSEFRRFGESGPGRWITIYARSGHTFAVIAGLRLDTTPYITGRERWAPGWQLTTRAPFGFEARHPVGL
jgi:hypothetical protein